MTPEPFVLCRGRGLPLIMIHGNGVDHRLLLPLDDCFEDDAWERLYLDLPGFGRTPPLPGVGGLPEIANWLVAAIRELVGDRPFAVLANSLGGLLARHVVAQFGGQAIGMALIAPVVDPVLGNRTLPELSVVECDEELIESLDADDRDEFTGVTSRQTADAWEAFRDHALPGIRSADGAAMNRLGDRYYLGDVPEEAAEAFVGPTVIVTGKQDHVVGYVDQLTLLDHYVAATYVALEGAGHNVHLEQRDVVSQLLRDWSRRAGAARCDN